MTTSHVRSLSAVGLALASTSVTCQFEPVVEKVDAFDGDRWYRTTSVPFCRERRESRLNVNRANSRGG